MIVGAGKIDVDRIYRHRREHGFPHWAVGFADAESTVRMEGRVATARGCIQCVAPMDSYAVEVRGSGPFSLYWCVFTPLPHWLTWMRWPELLPRRGAIQLNGEQDRSVICEVFSRLAITWTSDHPHRHSLTANLLERLLIEADGVQQRASNEVATDPRISQAVALVRSQPDRPFTTAELAHHVSLSVSRFTHLFREQTGMSPIRFADTIRIDYAKNLLLESNTSIAEIATATGFSCPYHFSARFRTLVGQSPRQYRREPLS